MENRGIAGILYVKLMKGFALLVSLLLLLLLTLFGFSLLLLAGSHYASARNLFENENAKIACESVLWTMVNDYNSETEEFRIANPPEKYWSGLRPFDWNGYTIELHLLSPWKAGQANRVKLSARRGQHRAEIEADVRQRRLEDFAFYCDVPQILNKSSVFDGLVFVRGQLSLGEPDVQFRDIVQAEVFPTDFASYRRKVKSNLNYPQVEKFLRNQFLAKPETPQDLAAFREGDNYVIDLDQLVLVKEKEKWLIQYKGKRVTEGTVLYFEDSLHVLQAKLNAHFHITNKKSEPLYLISMQDIFVESSLTFLESSAAEHPLCLLAKRIQLGETAPRASVIDAFVAALETEGPAVMIEPGGAILNSEQKKWLIDEINSSSFLMDSYKKTTFIAAVESDEKVVWFRGPLVQSSFMKVSDDVAELHFTASDWSYAFISSLQFVQVVEGSREWR